MAGGVTPIFTITLKPCASLGLLHEIEAPVNTRTLSSSPWCGGSFAAVSLNQSAKPSSFNNVTDSRGNKYEIPLVVGALATTPEIYGIGMGVPVSDIGEHWKKALAAPILAGRGPGCTLP